MMQPHNIPSVSSYHKGEDVSENISFDPARRDRRGYGGSLRFHNHPCERTREELDYGGLQP
jgi:hypothetical protein